MAYEVINLETEESHGIYDSLDEARGCVQFDGLQSYQIWRGRMDDGEFCGELPVETCEPDVDPENIYGLASIRQSIEADRK